MQTLLDLHLGPEVLNTAQAIGIPIALVGAVFLSFGAQFQSRGVKQVESRRATSGDELGRSEILRLIRNRSWLFGTLSLGLAIVLQLTSLRFAALIVVQPNVNLYFNAVVASGARRMGCLSPKVREEPAGSTAT